MKELKEIARDIIQEAIATAYCQLENKNFTEKEKELISNEIKKEATKALKTINRDYITF